MEFPPVAVCPFGADRGAFLRNFYQKRLDVGNRDIRTPLAIAADLPDPRRRVARELTRLIETRGKPQMIVSDTISAAAFELLPV